MGENGLFFILKYLTQTWIFKGNLVVVHAQRIKFSVLILFFQTQCTFIEKLDKLWKFNKF